MYIDSLAARGLISPDAMNGLLQRVGDLKNQRPFESGGGAAASNVYVPRTYGAEVTPMKGPEMQHEHAAALEAAGQNRAQFDAALKNAESLNLKDLQQVGELYAKAPVGMYKTKGAVLKGLTEAFIRNARFQNKIK